MNKPRAWLDDRRLASVSLISDEISRMSIWSPLKYDTTVPVTYRPAAPNKIAAADPRWSTKSAFESKDLLERQKDIETYSVEIAMLFNGLCAVISGILGRQVQQSELDFIANAGSPIVDNKHKISILMRAPIPLSMQVTRALVNGALQWSAEVIVNESTPVLIQGKLIDLKKASRKLEIDPVVATDGEFVSTERKRRKVKL